jgi:preprotein translocase subunit SecG
MPIPRSLSSVLSLFLLALGTVVDARKINVPRPDPFVDPRHDPYNPLKYIASNTLTAIAVVLVLAVGILQVWFIRKWGARWMMSMTIGAFTFTLGLATRFGLHKNPQSHGLYIVEYLFVVLSPCAFIAADYVLLGRIASYLGTDQYLLVSSRRITITFVSSDVTTFLIQAVGGAISASGSANNPSLALLGSHVFLAGLAAQLASFFVFWILYLVFLYRVKTRSPEIWSKDAGMPWYKNWLALAGALLISCIGILVRRH